MNSLGPGFLRNGFFVKHVLVDILMLFNHKNCKLLAIVVWMNVNKLSKSPSHDVLAQKVIFPNLPMGFECM